MKCNVGKTDRFLRAAVGLAALAAGLGFKSWWGALGLVPLATAIFRFCPAYIPFGLSTWPPFHDGRRKRSISFGIGYLCWRIA